MIYILEIKFRWLHVRYEFYDDLKKLIEEGVYKYLDYLISNQDSWKKP